MRRLGFPLRGVAIALAAGTALGGCASYYGGYGGYGGYSGLSVGIGTGSYYDDWGYYRSRPYWGWYDGYYYPGSGYYVYDRYRRPFRWTSRQQSYWAPRQTYWRERNVVGSTGTVRNTSTVRDRSTVRQSRRELRSNWNDFQRESRQERRVQRREARPD